MKHLTWMALVLWLTGTAVFGAEAPKIPQPPKPPAKVDENGNPWVAVDYVPALERAHKVPEKVSAVRQESPTLRKLRLGVNAPGFKDVTHRYLILDSPLLKDPKEPFNDLYQPVRFMHMKHAEVVGDCLACHHYRPAAEQASETTRCSACHQQAFDPVTPQRLGLKAALHQQCMDCHKSRAKGPLDCIDCHAKNVPDHKDLVKLPDNPDPIAVTRECLRCHNDQAEDMLTSAHWRWRGPSPHTVGREGEVESGKATNTINNFCIPLPSNWPRCTSCHAGYGWKDATFDFSDKTRMDCLVCHDTTLTYAKVPTDAGLPYPQLDLKAIAENVGKPSRKTCGDCHFQGGGGDAVKHGDMNSVLYYPSRSCDVHMGGMDFQCQDCHKTRNHKIPGRSLSLPVAEGSRSCEDCHTAQPHKYHAGEGHENHNLLNHHLNKHTDHLHCLTCHSPVYSKCKPSKSWWDWSKAGDKQRKVEKDKYGMPDYNWQKGEFRWVESAKPAYRWYNGKVKRYLVGDTINTDGVTRITDPVGEIWDDKSRIYPFKLMEGIQMADAATNQLIVPHLFGKQGYWGTLDWETSFTNGMKAVGLEYSGKYKWVQTVMYWGLNHETMPAENALGCAQCHEAFTGDRTCNRCHQDSRHADFKKLSARNTDFAKMQAKGRDVGHLVGQTNYLDFKAMGYKGDPVIFGGRFTKLPMGYKDPREQAAAQ